MADATGLIPGRLQVDADFQADIRNFLTLDDRQLPVLRSIVEPDIGLSGFDASPSDEAVESLGVDRPRAARLAYTLHFLIARLSEAPSVDAAEFVDELSSLVGVEVLGARRELLAQCISPTRQQRVDRVQRDTFAFGDTYLGVDIVPIFAHGADTRLYAGANVTIRYRTDDNTRRSLSINASAIELGEIAEALTNAKREAEAALAKLNEVAP